MHLVTTEHLRRFAKPEERAVACPICRGRLFAVLLTPEQVLCEKEWLDDFFAERTEEPKEKSDFTQDSPTFVVSCSQCGTVMRDPQPTAEKLNEMYRRDPYGESVLNDLAENQTKFFRQKFKSRRLPLVPGAKVLEVGSFVGGFLAAAKEQCWDAIGLDIGDETSRFMHDRGLCVLQTSLEDGGFRANSFDAVFIWNTFDQLAAARKILASAYALLKHGGMLVLRFPNGLFETACIRRRQLDAADRVLRAQAYNNFLTFPYLHGYTPSSTARLLAQHRFQLEDVCGDTLVRLADRRTKPFVQKEETYFKRAVIRACDLVMRRTGKIAHPWLDVYARKA